MSQYLRAKGVALIIMCVTVSVSERTRAALRYAANGNAEFAWKPGSERDRRGTANEERNKCNKSKK